MTSGASSPQPAAPDRRRRPADGHRGHDGSRSPPRDPERRSPSLNGGHEPPDDRDPSVPSMPARNNRPREGAPTTVRYFRDASGSLAGGYGGAAERRRSVLRPGRYGLSSW